jgi:DNA-binding response OmpR family regulator
MRVLVIEDQTQLGPSLRQSLEDEGYSIDQIESGENTDSLDDPADYDVVIQISTTSPVLRVDDLVVDTVRRHASRGGRNIDLTAREYSLLEFLVAHRGQVVTRSQIIQKVWNWTFMPTTNIVDVYIRYLRRKIDEPSSKKIIRTVHGVGYMIDG